jgi:Ni,Fe-hydrogenase III large subunit
MTFRTTLLDLGTRDDAHRPWPRVRVDGEVWRRIALEIAQGHATLLAVWSDGREVYMAVLDEAAGEVSVASMTCVGGRFPSIGVTHPPAVRFERAIADLYGLVPDDASDTRPWLDHGRWGVRHPLGAATPDPAEGLPYAFLPAEGPPLHQIPVGPVHAGIIEPGHFRFHANGETVVRLEERLGYVHKGIEGLFAGAPLSKAARLAGRISGDSTVAIALAFARAVEAATGVEAPPRAVWLRAVMAELERIANHLGDFGAICNDASFSLIQAHCGALREQVLRCANAAFGHRLMMDRVVPGGVACDLGEAGAANIRALIAHIRAHLPRLITIYDGAASLQDRTVTTGIARAALVQQYGAGGFVGRASGRAFDARKSPGYMPYLELAFDVPTRKAGDVDARVWIRLDEITESLSIIEQCLEWLPEGPINMALDEPLAAAAGGEGTALVEGFRGDVLAWVRLGPGGTIANAHIRDPSWLQWPLLEAAIEGNIVADFPLCNKSFNCSYSGHDL